MTLWKTLFPWMQREPSAGEDTPKDARQPEAAKPDKPAEQLDHTKVLSAAGSAAALGLTTAAAAGTLPPPSILTDLNRLSSLTAPHRAFAGAGRDDLHAGYHPVDGSRMAGFLLSGG